MHFVKIYVKSFFLISSLPIILPLTDVVNTLTAKPPFKKWFKEWLVTLQKPLALIACSLSSFHAFISHVFSNIRVDIENQSFTLTRGANYLVILSLALKFRITTVRDITDHIMSSRGKHGCSYCIFRGIIKRS